MRRAFAKQRVFLFNFLRGSEERERRRGFFLLRRRCVCRSPYMRPIYDCVSSAALELSDDAIANPHPAAASRTTYAHLLQRAAPLFFLLRSAAHAACSPSPENARFIKADFYNPPLFFSPPGVLLRPCVVCRGDGHTMLLLPACISSRHLCPLSYSREDRSAIFTCRIERAAYKRGIFVGPRRPGAYIYTLLRCTPSSGVGEISRNNHGASSPDELATYFLLPRAAAGSEEDERQCFKVAVPCESRAHMAVSLWAENGGR